MSYSIFILRRAQKELAQLPDAAYERARNAIRKLDEQEENNVQCSAN